MSRTPKFRGWDFCELIKAWNLPMSEDGLDDGSDLKTIRKHIVDSLEWKGGECHLDYNVKKDMLKFLDALVKTGFSGYIPVYRAMKKLDDHEFVEVYCAMLPHMWT